jgi:Sec-independent protein translocase protein TatA
MISLVVFLLFLGLIVFGPRKTIEYAQEIGRLLAHVKNAAGQLQHSALSTDKQLLPNDQKSAVVSDVK